MAYDPQPQEGMFHLHHQQQQDFQTRVDPWASASYPPHLDSSSSTPGPRKSPDIPGRNVARTPSPTPSEARALQGGVFDWHTLRKWRFWIRRDWIWYYVALVIILVITALVTLYHKQIVEWLTPVTRWLHDLKVGWLVPIAVLFVISFPPLFGHEIVAILCGLVWGLWIGFAIVSAGTLFGEIGNYYAFKYCCRARGQKMEKTKLWYACLAKVVRDGGFKIALIARLSAIPGHFTTAVFSTCGMGIVVFTIAAILSMPKQFITVYLGVILEQSATGETDKKSRIISDVVLAITMIITVLAMWYIFRQMNKVKPEVIYARRKARQDKLANLGNQSTSEVASTSEIPLSATAANYPFAPRYQGSSVHAPEPIRVANAYGYSKDVETGSEESLSTVEEYAPALRQGDYAPTRQSTENVAWDLGQPSRHRYAAPRSPPPGIAAHGPAPRFTASPPPTQSGAMLPMSSVPSPTIPVAQQSPTQQQFYVPPPHIHDPIPREARSPPLPMPNFPPPQAPSSHHEVEPTGMSYHTAMGLDTSSMAENSPPRYVR